MDLNILSSVPQNNRLVSLLMLCLPLTLSAFIHLWNPTGFPYIVGDEGHYIRRSLQTLDQLDPQEGARYDHPYFGQLLLAGIFKIIGYPDLVNPAPGNVYSTQNLYAIPRIIMGLFAVLDTFLIYKISERIYTGNKTIAFIASILFAVMPLTWLTRRIYLDSIQLPLILSSVYFMAYYFKKDDNNTNIAVRGIARYVNQDIVLILLSGIMLGLAIFTKIPAVTMIPVMAYLIFRNDKRNSEKVKAFGIWLVPVILIPALWPAYAVIQGEYDNWHSGVFSQAGRQGSGIGSIAILFKLDPVLVSIGIIGFVFALLVKRDIFLLLWIVPFLVFHTFVPWTQHFHWLQVLPAFCIAGAVLLNGLAYILRKKPGPTSKHKLDHKLDHYIPSKKTTATKRRDSNPLSWRTFKRFMKYQNRPSTVTLVAVSVAAIVVFGFACSTLLITTNVNASFFEMVTFISQSLPKYKETSDDSNKKQYSKGLCFWCSIPLNSYIGVDQNNKREEMNKDNKVTMIGNHWIFGTFWIPKYVFGKDHDFKGFFTKGSIDTDKVLIVADSRLLDAISSEDPEKHLKELKSLYDNSIESAKFTENRTNYNEDIYPYQSMSENRGIGEIVVKKNY